MRKLSNILVTFILLASTSGIVVNKHYAAGKLFSVSLYAEAESCCADGDMCSCCDVETDVAQLRTDYQGSAQVMPSVQEIELVGAPLFPLFHMAVITGSFRFLPDNHSPPVSANTTAALLQVYRL